VASSRITSHFPASAYHSEANDRETVLCYAKRQQTAAAGQQ